MHAFVKVKKLIYIFYILKIEELKRNINKFSMIVYIFEYICDSY